ncbi:hypothetical protein ABIA23_005482 [Sinorhizobium fredii]
MRQCVHAAGKQVIPFPEPATSNPCSDSVPRLIGEFELHGSAGLLLDDDRPVANPSGNCNTGNWDRDEITSSQFAVDREIEQRQVAYRTRHLEAGSDGQDLFRLQWRLLTDNAPRVPATDSLAPKATPLQRSTFKRTDRTSRSDFSGGKQSLAATSTKGRDAGQSRPFSVTCFISDLRGSWGDRKDQRFCQGVELWEPMTAEGRERALNQVFSRPGRTTWSAMSMPGCSRNRQANCHCQAALKAPGQVQLYRLHSQECRCV